MRRYELARFAILRKPEFFEIVTPAGGIYQLDLEMMKKLLSLHGQIPSHKLSEVEDFAKNESLIVLKEKIKPPFQIRKVMNNLNDLSKNILTISDLVLLINRRCNYYCFGCSTDSGSIKNNNNIDWQKIIRSGSSFGAVNLAITGGEPLLSFMVSEICSLVSFARSQGYENIVIATNGTYVPQCIVRLKEAGVTRLSVSFHGFDDYPEEYTGHKNAIKASYEAIKAVIESGLHLTVNCVLTKGNIRQLDRIVNKILDIIQYEEHAYLRFSPLIEVGRAFSLNKYALDENDYKFLFEKINSFKSDYGEKVRLTCDEECDLEDPMICDAGLVYAIVDEKGMVSSCDLLIDFPVGSINKTDFSKIWNNSEIWDDYRNVYSINDKCAQCETINRKICFGRCKALSLIRFNSLNMVESPEKCRALV